MLRTTLEQWRMVQAVADAGGFNQASQVIHKSQSTIHHAVQKLERSLGVSLFETRGRRVYVTAVGETMLRRARYLLEEAGKVESLAASLSQGIESELSVAVDHAFPAELVYRAIEQVSDAFPALCISLHETVLSGANELLQAEQADIAVSPFAQPDSLSEELCRVEFHAVASPNHPLHRDAIEGSGSPLTLEQLKSSRQIVVRDSARQINRDEGWLGADQRWTVDHLRTSVDLVCRGFGYAWLPLPLIDAALARGELLALPLGPHSLRHVTFYLNFPDIDRLGTSAQHFVGALRQIV